LHPSGLSIPDCRQGFVCDAFDEPIAQKIGRHAEGADVVLERNTLDDALMRCAGMNERAAERLEETSRRFETAGAMLGDLARTASDDILVAFPATLRVVRRAEPVGRRFDFFEDEAVSRWV